ncbi:MAG TPA: aminoacyl-tRNA hydrolase [Thermoanaerobaculia bacterium]
MKLIVGLGNPGREYRETRHNIGFMVADALAERWRVDDQWRERFDALQIKTTVGGEPVLLSKPLTFMNLSGQAVRELLHYFKVEPADLLVVIDDVNLPLGRLRARARGTAGGHNGLESIIAELGTTELARLRVGVGRGDRRRDLADYVLDRFDAGEKDVVDETIGRAADAAEMFAVEGIDRTMNQYNYQDPRETSD